MSRKRMLHPTFWDDPDLAGLSRDERLLFIGLISFADDYGHLPANPAVLRRWVFGYDDDLSVEQVRQMRDHVLSQCHNVRLYQHDGQEYLWLRQWEKHQDLRFRAKAQYPCHRCGQYHNANDYGECATADVPLTEKAETLTQNYARTTQDIAQPLPPDYVTLDKNTLGKTRIVMPPTGGIGADAPAAEPPSEAKAKPPERTPGQSLYLQKFAKKRFGTLDEAKAIAEIERDVGFSCLERALTWAAENNIRMLSSIRTRAHNIAKGNGSPRGPGPPIPTLADKFAMVDEVAERIERGESYFGR